jgi:hypothetical protein
LAVEYDELEMLRRNSPAWRLLRADNAALILSFLGRVFVDENVREISTSDLSSRLDDELHALNERLGAGTYPKPAKAYLDDWASPESSWLRKYYPPGDDEPHFDALPAVEKAVAFVRALRGRDFVGTESRLNTLFDLLRQMAFGTEDDPAKRLAELQRQRAGLDAEIQRVEQGDLSLLDTAGQRDRFQQFSATARELLADFREVEANFRELDRTLREQIAAWSGTKGELLDDVLTNRVSISDTDQGRSFTAFYDFLLSSDRQIEFESLLEQVLQLDALAGADPRTSRIHHDWLAAGDRTQGTVRLLSEQLRRFLDDQVWLENRRIIEILNSIQARAVAVRDTSGDPPGMTIDSLAPQLVLPMERRLYAPKKKLPINSAAMDTDPIEVDAARLFEQSHVDTAKLANGVRDALATKSQVSLAAVIDRQPLEHGLAELIAYFALSDDWFSIVFDEDHVEQVAWFDDGVQRMATLPRVSFVRKQRDVVVTND